MSDKLRGALYATGGATVGCALTGLCFWVMVVLTGVGGFEWWSHVLVGGIVGFTAGVIASLICWHDMDSFVARRAK